MNLRETRTAFTIESTIGVKLPLAIEGSSMEEELANCAKIWLNIQKENHEAITNYYPASFSIGYTTNDEKELEKCVKVSVLLNPHIFDLGLDKKPEDLFLEMLACKKGEGVKFNIEKVSREVQILLTYFANLIGAETLSIVWSKNDVTYITDLQNLNEAHLFDRNGEEVTEERMKDK